MENETQFFDRLRSEVKDAVLFYSPSIRIYHLVSAGKMDIRTAPKRFFLVGVYWAKLHPAAHRQNSLKMVYVILKMMFRLAWSFLRGVLARNKATHPFLENYLYEVTFRHFVYLGSLVQNLHNV